MSQASTFWPTAPDVGPGAKATTILNNLQRGDDIERPDVQGLTMLMWASAYGQTPTVQLLLSLGADVNCMGREEESPLHLAASSGCHELLTLLLRSGARVDSEDENGVTPLMFACMNNHSHAAHELLAAGADITRRNINGDTAYGLAVRQGSRQVQ